MNHIGVSSYCMALNGLVEATFFHHVLSIRMCPFSEKGSIMEKTIPPSRSSDISGKLEIRIRSVSKFLLNCSGKRRTADHCPSLFKFLLGKTWESPFSSWCTFLAYGLDPWDWKRLASNHYFVILMCCLRIFSRKYFGITKKRSQIEKRRFKMPFAPSISTVFCHFGIGSTARLPQLRVLFSAWVRFCFY